MKIIDQTPFQDEKGNISFTGRIQGTLKYGMDWYAEMEAQKSLMTQLNHALEKGFVLIRNLNLPGSPIVIPLILVSTGGIYVINVTSAKGQFEAKGDQWNVIDSGGNSQPWKINLLDKAVKLTRAFQKYLEINQIKVTAPIETVLVAVNPGAHIETMRPTIKVVKSDVIKSFIASLTQATPVWRADYVYDIANRIVEPPAREVPAEAQAAPTEDAQDFGSFSDSSPAASFDAGEFRGGFVDDAAPETAQPEAQPAAPAERPPQQARPRRAAQKKTFGMTRAQILVLVGIALFGLCLIGSLAALIFLNP